MFGHPNTTIDNEHRREFVDACDELIKGLGNRARRIRVSALDNESLPSPRDRSAGALTIGAESQPSEATLHPGEESVDDNLKIFIAAPTADVRRDALRMASRLSQEGYVSVLPVLEDTYENAEEVLSAMLQGCVLAIHFLGSVPGRRIGAKGETQVALQHNLTQQAGIPVLACRRDDIAIEELDEAYQTILADFEIHETDFARFQSYTLGVLDDMKRADQARAAEEKRKRDRRNQGLVSAPLVMIDGDESDREKINVLSDIIAGLDAYAMPVGYLDDIEETLKDATRRHDGAVIIFGRDPASRVRALRHFERLLQDLACAQNVRMQRMALCNDMGPTRMPPKGPGCDILTLYDGVNEQEVRNFVEKLRVRMDQRDDF